MVRFTALLVLVATGVADAQEVQFRWTDARGEIRNVRTAAEVPPDAWQGVTVDVHGADATSGERFRTVEGVTAVIEGIQAPRVENDGTVGSIGGAKARVRLASLIKARALTLELEGARRLPDGDLLAHVKRDDGKLLAEILLEEGLVRLCLEEGAMRYATVLRAAQARAQAARAGVWARDLQSPPPEPDGFRGVSLGLFAKDPGFDYSGFIDEIASIHASHVLIAAPWFMEDWKSTELWPLDGRTAGWPAIERVTRIARERGLAVVFQPLVLLRTGTVEHWKGDIAPTENWIWFRNYGRFVGEWADVARELGASMLIVGGEFASLESQTDSWRAVIANIRSRFSGTLTYSANWDHANVAQFWDDLDLLGMTGFHSLTRKNDPTVAELVAAWAPIRKDILAFQARVKKPVLFTEIGYTSQDGTNKDPWNYFVNPNKRDAAEQADCYRSLVQTWPDVSPEFRGMFIWNWWRDEAPKNDTGFSIFDKAAQSVIEQYFAGLAKGK